MLLLCDGYCSIFGSPSQPNGVGHNLASSAGLLRRAMKRILVNSKAVSGLLLIIVFCQTGVALLLTQLAKSTSTRGLGIVAFLLWVVISLAASLLYRRKLSPVLIIGVVITGFVLSFVAYLLVGYFGFDWTGLLKGRNG